MKHLTAAVKDAVLAAGIPAWDPRHNAAVAKATGALTALANAAQRQGPSVEEHVWNGYFKLSANEPHRLPKLVDSIVSLRLDAVAIALLAYDHDH